jgi:hypothetical protein
MAGIYPLWRFLLEVTFQQLNDVVTVESDDLLIR